MQRKQSPLFRRVRVLALALAFCAPAAGCGAPYVHIGGEFNRARADFGRPVSDVKEVTVCYSGFETSARAAAEMAEARCAEFGKTAVFETDTMTVCPAMTPTAAKFICVKKDAAADEDESIRSYL